MVYLLGFIIISPLIMRLVVQRSIHSRLMAFFLFLGPLVSFLSTVYFWLEPSISAVSLKLVEKSGYLNFVHSNLVLDSLSGLIITTVLSVAAISFKFSIRYLAEDSQKIKFYNNMSFLVFSVSFMLLVDNLLFFLLGWMSTSYFLHHLLTHFKNDSEAIKGARQKFWVSRFADALFIFSFLVILMVFKTLNYKELFLALENQSLVASNLTVLTISAIALIIGVMAKSAQYPFHYWLPNTMNTPAPVSAIMHAGVINAGGYLVIRLNPFLTTFSLSLDLLLIIGAITTLVASIIMLTQTNIKRSLGYSTIAQMGFMMVQLGLGAFALATFHLVGHAFYKSFAFLSSGTVTDNGRLNRFILKKPSVDPSLFILLSVPLFILFLTYLILIALNIDLNQKPGGYVLITVLVLALSQITINSLSLLTKVLIPLLVGTTYLCIYGLSEFLFDGVLSAAKDGSSIHNSFFSLLTIVIFTSLYLFQNNLSKISGFNWGQKLYVKLYA